jgi:hypothetical protein
MIQDTSIRNQHAVETAVAIDEQVCQGYIILF